MGAYHHATCIVIGEAGVLIRGASGSGKSALARALMTMARRLSLNARLVGDDRVFLEAAAGRLLARPHAAISGRLEARGMGILTAPAEPACVVRLVADLIAGQPDRLPDLINQTAALEGVSVPRLVLSQEGPQTDLIFTALGLSPASFVAENT